jgi:hypothetical protein
MTFADGLGRKNKATEHGLMGRLKLRKGHERHIDQS